MQRRWLAIIALWLLGVLAAAQLAKFSTIAPVLRARFALSLPATGLLISLLEVGGGVLGFVAGLALGRIGYRRSLVTGLATLAGCSLVEALATTPAPLFVARGVEGIGYLLVVIAAPTAIAAIAHDHDRPRALALWSSFVPVGVAVGGAVTGMGTHLLDATGLLLLWAALLALAVIPALRLPLGTAGPRGIALPAPAAWIATLAFGIYTLFLCALTMLLPTFLTDMRGASLATAGLVAAFASLAALPGSAIAIALMRRGALSPRAMMRIVVPALAVTALLAPLVFAEIGGWGAAALVAILAVGASGLVSPLVFARLPLLARAASADDPRIATANGLLTQFGAGGALIGPPLGGLVVGLWGWPGLGIAIALLSLAMLATIALAERIAARPAL
ncbi:MFS transporter [uncultured Sphingomonas sp.]|uniref:MFS transporter n=1 Tax=uncultured Sphingomonas sp. TaxID=158754 RepID=UPI002622D619|nr:MFS transporter [uncultured Sphingomonas sp.]